MQAEQNERPTEIAVWLNLPPSTAANNIISSQERLANVIPSAFRASQGFMTYPDSGSGIPTPTYRTEIDNPDSSVDDVPSNDTLTLPKPKEGLMGHGYQFKGELSYQPDSDCYVVTAVSELGGGSMTAQHMPETTDNTPASAGSYYEVPYTLHATTVLTATPASDRELYDTLKQLKSDAVVVRQES